MTWTKITKPSTDDWSGIAKPAESSVLVLTNDAQPWGMLIAITKPSESSSVISGWTDISKPTSSVWTLVAKPT